MLLHKHILKYVLDLKKVEFNPQINHFIQQTEFWFSNETLKSYFPTLCLGHEKLFGWPNNGATKRTFFKIVDLDLHPQYV